MLSVIIETLNDEDGLARTLASLVGGAVEGMVKDVVVCDRGSTDDTFRVAEHAGCAFLGDGDIGAAIRRARGDWLMLLEPGARLGAGWIEAVTGHVAETTQPARFARSQAGRPWLPRVFSARRPLVDGLVIAKRQAAALAQTGADARQIARRVSARRLEAEIQPAPRRK